MLPRLSLVAVAGMTTSLSSSTMFRVRAAEDTSPSSSNSTATKRKIKASELPIYGDPEPAQYELVPEEPSIYFKTVSDGRKLVWEYTGWMQGTADKVISVYRTTVKYTKDGLQYIQEDSGVLPRAAVITVSGLGGIIAGYRGGFLRKYTYATAAMVAAAAICYPHQATDISQRGWKSASDLAAKTYRDNFSTDGASKKTEAPTSGSSNVTKLPKLQQHVDKAPASGEPKKDVIQKDFGMSNPNDKDMYTTRGK